MTKHLLYGSNEDPMLSPGFLKYILNNDFEEKNILELGAGFSTLFFAKHFKHVFAYEVEENWVNILKEKAKSKNLNNISLYLHGANLFREISFLENLQQSDVILIDGNIPRHECVYFIDKFKKDDAVIVLDDGIRNMIAYKFLRDNYYCYDYLREDEYGITQTSVFFERINLKDREVR